MKRKAVSPVLAVLLMIAVSVALSVVMFTWSQGFLSNQVSAVDSQTSEVSTASQSRVMIELAYADSSSDKVIIFVRNIGTITTEIGSVIIEGHPNNYGFKDRWVVLVDGSLTKMPSGISVSPDSASSYTLQKGASLKIEIDKGSTSADIQSGDYLLVEIHTKSGNVAQYGFTVR